jgi:large subunit ribosomal protein L4
VKVNRRARRRALRAALSVHARRGSIAVVDASSYSEPSTGTAAKALDTLEDAGKVLVLLGVDEIACAKSFRNIARAVVLPARDAGVADVVGARTLVLSEAAVEELQTVAAEPKARAAQEAA